MNYKECKEKLKRYSLARIPFIPFYTIERQRALDILRETAKDLSLPFYVHTLSKGMYDIVTEKSVNDDKTVIGALDFIAEQINLKANLTFIFTDVSELDADTTTARYIFDIVNLAEEKGASIIVITQDTVWSNLQRLGMSLDLDLPSEDEVYDIIAENIEPYKNSIKVDWDENDYREAALTLTGITKVEIQNVIVSLIASRHIKKADLLELKFAKDKLFSDINGLEKIEVSSDIADVGGLGEIVTHGEDGMKSYAGNPNSLADSILELLYNPGLCNEIVKKAKLKVKNEYGWEKIAQDTHFIYQKAICQTMAERQARQIEQEKARKTKKAGNTEGDITKLLAFKKRHAYA